MQVPPGIQYLFHILPSLSAPSLLAFAISRLLRDYYEVDVPTWLTIFACIIAQPAAIVISRSYSSFRYRADAASRGASTIPEIQEGTWSAGLSTMAALVKNFKTGYPGDIFADWRNQYGNIYLLKLTSESRILTFEPDHIKAILATQFENFEKGSILYSQFHSLLGTGVFNSDGNMWKFHRTMTRPFFNKERISHFDVFATHADDAINQAKARLAEGYPIDYQDLVARFTLDSATEFLFGDDVHSLSAGLPYPESSPQTNSPMFVNHPSNIFVNAFIAGQNLTALRSRVGPSWPLLEFWSDKVKPHREVVDRFVEPILAEAIAKRKAKVDKVDIKNDDDESVTLLDHLVKHTDDIQVLKDELVNLLVAARDTTSSTLTFAMYMLAEHPEVTQRLREEILNRVGPTARPTYDDMREMKYLRAFINETLRLYPPVPFDSRVAKHATVLDSKKPGSKAFYVPAGAKCTYGVFLMHRRTDLWGPDALEFDPNRFLDERLHKYLTPNPFIFVPFNAGPRICLGQQFAYHETSFFLVRLLQRFSEFSLATDAQPPASRPPASWAGCAGSKGRDKVWPGIHLTMYARGGLWVRMEEAKAIEVV